MISSSLKKLELAIVTGSPKESIYKIFTDKKVRSNFNLIITRDDVLKSKTNPESYLLAIQKLDLHPNEIIAFEDTYNGITSAKNAGIMCFGIQKDKSLHHKLKNADKIFLTLKEAKEYIEKQIL